MGRGGCHGWCRSGRAPQHDGRLVSSLMFLSFLEWDGGVRRVEWMLVAGAGATSHCGWVGGRCGGVDQGQQGGRGGELPEWSRCGPPSCGPPSCGRSGAPQWLIGACGHAWRRTGGHMDGLGCAGWGGGECRRPAGVGAGRPAGRAAERPGAGGGLAAGRRWHARAPARSRGLHRRWRCADVLDTCVGSGPASCSARRTTKGRHLSTWPRRPR